MNEITIFALALLSVPVFARFARVNKETLGIFHLIALGGIFLILGEATRITASKLSFIESLYSMIDILTAALAYLTVLAGTVWITLYYLKHPKEI